MNDLKEISTKNGTEADATFSFRLLEYGRQRLSLLSRLGADDVLFERVRPDAADKLAIRAAFELGAAVAEHRYMRDYENYLLDGMAIDHWRHEGLPKAREERLRQGRRTRNAIERAAKGLREEDPDLARNDTETARRIRALGLPELDKGNGQQLGIDAITGHLRAIRKAARSAKNRH